MSEEQSFFGQIKGQLIAGVGVVITAVGGIVISQVEGLLGVEDEAAPVEQVAPAQQQSVNVTGPEIVINIPEQKKDTVEKKVYVKPKPKLTETEKRKKEFDW
jgi:predicted small secreted protein